MNMEQDIEKTLKEQIIDKMISSLKDSEQFSDDFLAELEVTDLSNKQEVKDAISKATEEVKNEDTQTGN
jgi:inorganic pyrophosphatase